MDPIIGSALMGVGTGVAGIVGDQVLNQQQFNQEQELMDIQLANQQTLNEQGHDLQMQMWKDTNYPAQVQMMKSAGLNPALMYGMKGGGGTTTGSQGGGAAAKGNAPQNKGVNMQNIMMGLQMKNLQAQTDNIKADTQNKGGELEGINLDNARKEIENTWLNEKEKATVDKLLEETKNLSKDNALKDISIGLKENGMFNELAATVIGVISGWDLTEKGALDKEVMDMEGVLKYLPEGTTFDGKVTRRAVLNAAITAAIAGKMLWSKIDGLFSLFAPKMNSKMKGNMKQTSSNTFEIGG